MLTAKDATCQSGQNNIADDLADPDKGKCGVDDETGHFAG